MNNRGTLAMRPSELAQAVTLVFHGISQYLQAMSRSVPHIRPRTLPSTSFPINHSLIILSFDLMKSELLAASLNQP
jgi:hypothetical protein